MQILSNIMMKKSARFTELNTNDLSSDHFSYHLNKLIELGLIYKDENGEYALTKEGSLFVVNLDHISAKVVKQPTIIVMAVCTQIIEDKRKFLIQKRRKHPDFGFYSIPEGKVEFGSSLEENVLRELEEETGLSGKPVLKEIKHLLKKKKNGNEIVKDLLFYAYRIDDIEGDLVDNEEGESIWMTLEEYRSLSNTYDTNLETLESVLKEGVSIYEKVIDIEG